MTNREQWKQLRAPVVREAWANRNPALYWANMGMVPCDPYYQSRMYARDPSVSADRRQGYRYEFGAALNKLTEMRDAEAAGENPLLYKLASG